MTKNTKIALGIAGAVAAGAILGMMLAPEKGSDMRKRVKDKASDLADHLNDMVAGGKEKLAGLKKKMVGEANGMLSTAEEKFNDF